MKTKTTIEEIRKKATEMALKEYPEDLYPVHGDKGISHGDNNEEARQAYYDALMVTLPLLYSMFEAFWVQGGDHLVNRRDNQCAAITAFTELVA